MLGLRARARIIKSSSTSLDTPQKQSYYKKGNRLAPTSKFIITNYYIKKSSIYTVVLIERALPAHCIDQKGVHYFLSQCGN